MSLKIFGKSAVIYSVGTISVRAISFILIPVYTHFLSIEDYGLLSTILLTIQILVTLIDLGMLSGILRFFTEYKSKKAENELISSALTVNFMNGSVITVLTIILLPKIFNYLIPASYEFNLILCIALSALSQTVCINMLSFYRAKNKFVLYTVTSLIIAALITGLTVFFLVILKWGIVGVLTAQIIAYGSMFLFLLISTFKDSGFLPSKTGVISLIRFGFPLIFSRSGDIIFNTTGLYFLSFFAGLGKVGLFALATKIAAITGMVLIFPFQLSYQPFIFSQINNPEIKKYISRIATYLLIVFYIVTFFLVVIFRDLIKVIAPPEYYSAYNIIFLLLPISAMMGFQYIGQSLLLIKNRTNTVGAIIAITSLISICINFFFIKYFSLAGIIIVANLNALMITILLFIFGFKVYKVDLEKHRILIMILLFISTMFFIFQIQNTSTLIFYSSAILLFILSFYLLYSLNYFQEDEKKFIKNSVSKLRYVIVHKII